MAIVIEPKYPPISKEPKPVFLTREAYEARKRERALEAQRAKKKKKEAELEEARKQSVNCELISLWGRYYRWRSSVQRNEELLPPYSPRSSDADKQKEGKNNK